MKLSPLLAAAALSLPTAARAFTSLSMMSSAFPPSNRASPLGKGDRLESGASIKHFTAEGSQAQDAVELFAGKKVVVFGVPGAFTPTCSEKHLPGYLELCGKLKEKGADDIMCISVNDAFVMKCWAESKGVDPAGSVSVKFVADGNGELSAKMGLLADKTGSQMGFRCKRFAAIFDDCKVVHMAIDENGLADSSADAILKVLEKL